MGQVDFDIAVFAVNEAAAIAACIASIDRDCAGRSAHISVLLNGTTDNTIELLQSTRLAHASMTVYRFPIADKANAINYYLYELRHAAAVHFCIDAYARIGKGSFRAMAAAFATQPQVHIASALPVSGRSARVTAANIMKGGAVNGNLYAVRPDFIERLVAARYRLPLQIYRTDPLLGAMAAHDLDSINKPWDDTRLIGVAEASFAITPLSIFRLRDIRRQYNREIRQARGRMENEAIKAIAYTTGFAALPDNANDMIKEWLKSAKPSPRSMREAYFTRRALHQLRISKNIEAVKPVLLTL
jgi:hypothetical protein